MTQYAKLIDGQLQLCAPRHISNPRADVLEAYALANGYKPIVEETQPHRLTTPYYRETEKQIRRGWLELELESARTLVIAEITAEKNRILASSQVVEIDGNLYDYHSEAEMNLLGICASGLDSTDWTLHDYSVITLNQTGLASLRQAFLRTKQEIYAWQANLITRIQGAENVSELAALQISYHHVNDII